MAVIALQIYLFFYNHSGNMHFHTVATQDLLAPNNDCKAPQKKWQFVSFVSRVTVSKAVEL